MKIVVLPVNGKEEWCVKLEGLHVQAGPIMGAEGVYLDRTFSSKKRAIDEACTELIIALGDLIKREESQC